MAKLTSVCPVSDEDTNALPVKNLAGAIAFYENVLGFSVVNRDSSSAVLARDHVQIGILRKVDHEPAQAGSIAFAVDSLEAMRSELEASGANPGELGLDEWGGKRHRTFFVREAENGYCYCFYAQYRPIRNDRRVGYMMSVISYKWTSDAGEHAP